MNDLKAMILIWITNFKMDIIEFKLTRQGSWLDRSIETVIEVQIELVCVISDY